MSTVLAAGLHVAQSLPGTGGDRVNHSDPLGRARDWAESQQARGPQAVVSLILAAVAFGLGAETSGEVERLVDSATALQKSLNVNFELNMVDGNAVRTALQSLLVQGWEPPSRDPQGFILQSDERFLGFSPHERRVYTAQQVSHRSGAFIAFGNPLLLAATALGSAAVNSASKGAAQRRAAAQWRLGGRGRMCVTTRRILLFEDKLISIGVETLQAISADEDELHLIADSGVPIALKLPPGVADIHSCLLASLAGRIRAEAGQPEQNAALSAKPSITRPLLSPDGKWWWEGSAWVELSERLPAGSVLSPDKLQWYDGTEWRVLPTG